MKIAICLIVAFASCKGNSPKQCGGKCNDGTPNVTNFLSSFTSGSTRKLGTWSRESLQSMCANKNTAQNFARCTFGEMESCMTSEQIGIVPDVGNVVESISYLCENAKDVNFTCVAASIEQKYTQCMSTDRLTPPTDVSNSDGRMKYTCGVFSMHVSCYKDSTSDCQGRSGEIMAKFLEYQTPRACDATMVRISLGLLVISLCYMLLKNII